MNRDGEALRIECDIYFWGMVMWKQRGPVFSIRWSLRQSEDNSWYSLLTSACVGTTQSAGGQALLERSVGRELSYWDCTSILRGARASASTS